MRLLPLILLLGSPSSLATMAGVVSWGGLSLAEVESVSVDWRNSRGGMLRVRRMGWGIGCSSQAWASCRAASALLGVMAGSCLASQFLKASCGVDLFATRSGGTECTFR